MRCHCMPVTSGIQMDEKLVANTRNIDVILGGHSHTFMESPKNYLNIDGKNVPVMHTGRMEFMLDD